MGGNLNTMILMIKPILSIMILLFFCWVANRLLTYIAISMTKKDKNKQLPFDEAGAFVLWYALVSIPSILVIHWLWQ